MSSSCLVLFFFFKQKTAYEMRISDWSSDVCSSDLNLIRFGGMRPDRDWLQFDCALSYGLVEYLRTLDMLKDHGWSSRRVVPHGGHQMSLNIAAGLHLGGNERDRKSVV